MADKHTSELWDLVYGLLDEQDETRVKDLVTSDPEVAREYSRVVLQSELLAKAAKLEADPITLSRSDVAEKTKPSVKDVPSLQRRRQPQSDFARLANWIVTLAATGLLLFTGYSYFRPDSVIKADAEGLTHSDIADDYVRTVVVGPAKLEPNTTNTFQVRTTNVNDEPVSAEVEVRLYDAQGRLPYEERVVTDEQGLHFVSLPQSLAINNARLELETSGQQPRDIMKTHLQLNDAGFRTYVTTDKPMYRPGETVYFRSVTLSRFGLSANRDVPVAYELLAPAGNAIPNVLPTGLTQKGVGNGAFPIQPGMPGGKYTIVAKSPASAFPEVRREFFIRDYRPPRLKKELEFTRDSYSPGDEVVADFSAERTEGGVVADRPLRISAVVDGTEVYNSNDVKTSSTGTHQVTFTLPKEIEIGDATLSIVVDDGGTQETMAKTIPINLGKVAVEFFPEGGELVAGVSSRVYFFAVDPLGKSVHIEGEVVDSSDKKIADVETKHEGRGWFAFSDGQTPQKDETYRLKITKPAGVSSELELPAVGESASVVMEAKGVLAAGEDASIELRAAKGGLPLVVAATCRGASVGQTDVVVKRDRSVSKKKGVKRFAAKTKVKLPAEVDGVVRLTVYDHSQQPPVPIAERLVYRQPQRQLELQVQEGASHRYSPGEKVKVKIAAKSETKQPVPAVMGVTVVDDSVLSLADERRASMTTQFWLASEIEKPEDLEDIEFFVGDDEESRVALDLLLGTQGWRKFVDASAAAVEQMAAKAGAEVSNAIVEAEAADEPLPLVYDNYAKTKRAFSQAIVSLNQVRELDIQKIGTWIFYGGAAIVVALMLLALSRMLGSVKQWVPTLTSGACCLIVGWLWMGAQVEADGSVALNSFTSVNLNDSPEVVAHLEEAVEFEGRDFDDDFGVAEGLEEEERALRFGAPEMDGVMLDDVALGAMPMDEAPDQAHFLFGMDGQEKKLRELGRLAQGRQERDAFFLKQAAPGMDGRARFANRDMFIADPRGGMGMGGFGGGGRWMNELNFMWMDMDEMGQGMVGGGGFGDMGPGRYRARAYNGVNLGLMYQQLERAAQNKDLSRVAKYTAVIEQTLQPYRFPVRQYAHVHKKPQGDVVRQDFAETIYWQPLLIAGDDGTASFEFDLSDSVTTYKILIDGHGAGRIGTSEADVISRIPFSLEPKMPLEVTAGDRIDLPLALNNDTDGALPVELTVSHNDLLELTGETKRSKKLKAGERARDYYSFDVVGDVGDGTIEFAAKAGDLNDSIKKSVRVVPPGFPFANAIAGQLDGEQEVTVTLPKEWVPGSLKVSLTAYPSALADIRDGIDGIIREPSGCFEQASSSNYPNIWALRFMQDHDIADPNFTRRAKGFLKNGYAKLVGYECSKKGYEWFGGDPGHEALTAYGLMEFRDMSAVWDVDQEMVQRTAEWLMKRRDGKGGFLRNSRALDSFGGAPEDITNAYIVWALTEAGQEGIDKELDQVLATAEDSDDPYLVSLAACAAVNANRDEHVALLAKLTDLQEDDGHLVGKNGSITRSGGISLKVETTSLAAVAWLNATIKAGDDANGKWAATAQQAIQWIAANRSGGGGFGSTQATVLALKALVLNAELNKHAMSDGALVIQIDGGDIGRTEFSADQVQPIKLQGIGGSLKAGENKLTLSLTEDNKMPYALDIAYRTRKPNSSDDCKVRLSTKLSSEKVEAGETVGLQVELENATDEGQPMVTAIVGLPAGLEARQEKLEELKEAGKFDYYEQKGRELVFYWRALGPDVKDNAKIDFTVDVIAEIPGNYEGPASRVYLYYTAEEKYWNEPLTIEITR